MNQQDIWTKVYTEEKQRALDEWLHAELPLEPLSEDFPNTTEWIDAMVEYKKERDRKWEHIFETLPRMKADRAAARGTLLSWDKLRDLVWERDGAICDVCDCEVLPEAYNCGHIVDKMVGGTDKLENLVVMHEHCNMVKPIHETPEQYKAWCDSGYWLSEICQIVREELEK